MQGTHSSVQFGSVRRNWLELVCQRRFASHAVQFGTGSFRSGSVWCGSMHQRLRPRQACLSSHRQTCQPNPLKMGFLGMVAMNLWGGDCLAEAGMGEHYLSVQDPGALHCRARVGELVRRFLDAKSSTQVRILSSSPVHEDHEAGALHCPARQDQSLRFSGPKICAFRVKSWKRVPLIHLSSWTGPRTPEPGPGGAPYKDVI